MLCPHCMYEGKLVNGSCARCGYNIAGTISRPLSLDTARSTTFSRPLADQTIRRGDILHDGRYRLMNQMELPETQQRQGVAWSALDNRAANRRVVIREICVPAERGRTTPADQMAYEAAQRLSELGNHQGFPQVVDFFRDKGTYFLVLLHPEGESLASLLKQQGGALPEYMIAEYGYQLCGLLTLLAAQQSPMVHGSINPETIIISEDRQFASLIHTPLFHPDPLPAGAEKGPAGYYAPEQIRGGIAPTSDLYSLAVTMHHAVTGYDPYARLALFHPPARRLNPATTAQMEMILVRQLSLSPAQRYGYPTEMQQDLAALIASYPDPTEEEQTPQAVNPLTLSSAQLRERSRSMTMLNMGVFAAICVLLLIGMLFAVLRP